MEIIKKAWKKYRKTVKANNKENKKAFKEFLSVIKLEIKCLFNPYGK